MHHFGHFDAAALAEDHVYRGHSTGYRRAPLVDQAVGSVHTGLSICELAPGGTIAPHVHSYEESFYVLGGEAILRVNDQAYRVGPGDLGAFKWARCMDGGLRGRRPSDGCRWRRRSRTHPAKSATRFF
jgi:uncharacterized cupin superfamily protein